MHWFFAAQGLSLGTGSGATLCCGAWFSLWWAFLEQCPGSRPSSSGPVVCWLSCPVAPFQTRDLPCAPCSGSEFLATGSPGKSRTSYCVIVRLIPLPQPSPCPFCLGVPCPSFLFLPPSLHLWSLLSSHSITFSPLSVVFLYFFSLSWCSVLLLTIKILGGGHGKNENQYPPSGHPFPHPL